MTLNLQIYSLPSGTKTQSGLDKDVFFLLIFFFFRIRSINGIFVVSGLVSGSQQRAYQKPLILYTLFAYRSRAMSPLRNTKKVLLPDRPRRWRAEISPLKLMNSCPRRKRNNPLFQQFALPYILY